MKPTEFQYSDFEDVETDAIRWSVLDTQWGSNTGAIEDDTAYGKLFLSRKNGSVICFARSGFPSGA